MSKPASHNTTAVRWTRSEVARALGVSVTSVRRLEGSTLVPQVDENGVRWFDVNTVKALRASRGERPSRRSETDGEVASRVFALFRRGIGLRDIVIDAKVEPARVRQLYTEWLVNLREGELHRRAREQQLADERDRARMERETRRFEADLRRTLGPPK